MSLGQLSEELGKLGRPILASGLSKIETGERRVDVDDLVALAVALDVSPSRLLLPGEQPQPLTGADLTWEKVSRHGKVQLTPAREAEWGQAWAWACGESPLSGVDVQGEWRAENHPQGDRRITPQDVERLSRQAEEAAAALTAGLQALRDAGFDARPPKGSQASDPDRRRQPRPGHGTDG
jgi:transcriptional regulator with XRE-family HTH domain